MRKTHGISCARWIRKYSMPLSLKRTLNGEINRDMHHFSGADRPPVLARGEKCPKYISKQADYKP